MTKKAWIISIVAFVLGIAIAISSLAIFTDIFKKDEKDIDKESKIDLSAYLNSDLCEENIEYLIGLKNEVTIMVVGAEEDFLNSMAEYAYYIYGIDANTDASGFEYYKYTLAVMRRYDDMRKITVKFVDPQTSDFTAIKNEYSNEILEYGSIIVASGKDEQKRVKVLNFDDIYVVSEGNAVHGQAGSITGNKIESALTGAIAYVTSEKIPKVALLKGHSPNVDATAYRKLLELNNYRIDVIEDLPINTISSDYDAIIISGPTIDFTTSEIDVISAFLENGGKKGKGLIFFADAASKPLTNLYIFLKQWGIEVGEGILFETDASYTLMQDDPSVLPMFPQTFEDDKITETISTPAAFERAVPMKVCEDSSLQREAKALMCTTESVVVAPIGAEATWSDPEAKKQSYDTVIQSVETNYGKDNAEYTSYIMAFASYNMTESVWAGEGVVSNQNIVMACTDRAAHIDYEEFTFPIWTYEEEEK